MIFEIQSFPTDIQHFDHSGSDQWSCFSATSVKTESQETLRMCGICVIHHPISKTLPFTVFSFLEFYLSQLRSTWIHYSDPSWEYACVEDTKTDGIFWKTLQIFLKIQQIKQIMICHWCEHISQNCMHKIFFLN